MMMEVNEFGEFGVFRKGIGMRHDRSVSQQTIMPTQFQCSSEKAK
jgi:hypothetical protein